MGIVGLCQARFQFAPAQVIWVRFKSVEINITPSVRKQEMS
jgi:hypothetical protein